MKKPILTQLFLLWTVLAFGQPSTICHEDGTVTFQYRNDQAKEVMVDVQFAGRKAMTRDAETGLWTVTLGPAAPDMYPYCFIVDGVSVMDPFCDLYFPNEGFKNSLLEIPSTKEPLAHDIRQVPHGTLEYIHYYSQSLGATNQAVVYLPPGYQMHRDKKYPVFYLISGTTDTEEVYYKVGRVNYILDNLIADSLAEEMIVVLPYGNPTKLKPTNGMPFNFQSFGGDRGRRGRQGNGGFSRRRGNFGNGMTPPTGGGMMPNGGGMMPPAGGMMPPGSGRMPNAGGMFADIFSQDLNNDLMPYIESHYRTINDADHRAIGGFSRGGNQALANGLSHLNKFSYLCSYSSFTSTDIPNVYDQAEDTNKKIHLFWLGVGTDDFLYGNARDYMEFLDKKGIRSVKEFTHDKFGHTWMNAKYFLDRSLRLLFKPEAAEAAMKEGKPAPAATGQEQQFTAGTMARLFPRSVVSPEFGEDAITFRFKAPDAKKVSLVTELLEQPMTMERDSDGVWQVELKRDVMSVFTYYYLVDGTPVADPQNMYLAPTKGFKPSICSHPAGVYNFASMENIPHGTVSYNPFAGGEAWYMPAGFSMRGAPVIIQLVPRQGDTDESWFKIGAADAVADRLCYEKNLKPFLLTTSKLDFYKEGEGPKMNIVTLRASDYKTWTERQQALQSLLLSLVER